MPNLELEIIEVNEIEGGIEVFARAWSDGAQIGFGADGTIDIERFRIFNPPVLVLDPLGEIVKEFPANEEFGTPAYTVIYRYDPQEAALQSLEHTISTIKNKVLASESIVPEKRGNTTSTFYPSLDGYSRNTNANFATCRNATAGNETVDNGANTQFAFINNTYNIRRMFYLFDTSAIPDSDTISAATFSVYGNTAVGTDSDANSATYHIVSSNPASNTALANADYDQVGTTSFASMAYGSWNTAGYNDFSLDSNGIANISLTGVSKFAARQSNDFNNSAPTGTTSRTAYLSEQTGTTNDPKLVVEHAAAGAAFIPRVTIY